MLENRKKAEICKYIILHYLTFVLNICWSADHLGSLGSGGGPQSSCFQSSQVGRLVSDRVETIWFDWLANSVDTSVTTGENIYKQTKYEKNEIYSFFYTICQYHIFSAVFISGPTPPIPHLKCLIWEKDNPNQMQNMFRVPGMILYGSRKHYDRRDPSLW